MYEEDLKNPASQLFSTESEQPEQENPILPSSWHPSWRRAERLRQAALATQRPKGRKPPSSALKRGDNVKEVLTNMGVETFGGLETEIGESVTMGLERCISVAWKAIESKSSKRATACGPHR